MRLRTRFFILMTAIFIAFVVMVWIYSGYLSRHINEHWGLRMAEKQVLIDKQRTLLPLIREIALARQLAAEPALQQMALNEQDPEVREQALRVLERYRNNFQDHNYFLALASSNHYYFNDADNQYAGRQLRYTLSPDKQVDRWFYATVDSQLDYQVNVDPDVHLDTVKVWINVAIKHRGRTVALIGTGMDMDAFIENTVSVNQPGVHNLFVDRDLAVQLHRDQSLIDFASITKAVDQRRRVDVLLPEPEEVQQLQSLMHRLERQPNKIDTLWVTYNGKRQLLGVAFLPEIGWFDLTLMDVDTLTLFDRLHIAPWLGLIFMATLLALGLMLHRLVLGPLQRIGQVLDRIQQGDCSVDPPLVGTGEIARLSAQFREMVHQVRNHSHQQEEQIAERTEQLSRELAEHKKTETELRRSETLLRTLHEATSNAILLLNAKALFDCNPAALELFGSPGREQLLSLSLADLLSGRQQPTTAERLHNHLDIALARGSHRFEWLCRRLDNHQEFPAEILLSALELEGETLIQVLLLDISERKQAERKIQALAYYDPLTGLHNRFIFNDRLSQTLINSKRHNQHAGLLVIDLDNFKPLNDRYGHGIGDQLLIAVAQRLRQAVREVDTVARIGGDEFVVILTELSAERSQALQDAEHLAEKLCHTLAAPYPLRAGHMTGQNRLDYRCSCSIGLVVFQDPTESPQALFDRADAAMYRAKQAGGNRVRREPDPEPEAIHQSLELY